MISLLLSLATVLPVILNLVGMIMAAFGASKEDSQIYQDMVAKQNASGDLSVISHDRHQAHIAAIEARIAAKEKANGQKSPPV